MICPKCSFDIRGGKILNKHVNACTGLGPRSKRASRPGGRAWAKGLTAFTDASIAQARASMEGIVITGKAKTPEAEAERRNRISASARANGNTGGYREGAGRSKKIHVLDSFGARVCLQSSHERILAEWLNARAIKWKREGCFRYDNNRRYFPDFHLVETDEYLDIKNDYLIGVDANKINRVREQNPSVKLRVFTLKNMESALAHL